MNGSESSIQTLASMLDPSKNMPPQQRPKNTTAPSSINPTPSKPTKNPPQKDIWDEDEIDYTPDDADPRPEAEYKITYRQRVTSEDIYLNMSGRLPSITDSDDLVLSIHMPGIKTASELELTCEKDKVDVRCEKYKTIIPLPKQVDDKKGTAKWDAKTSTLIISAPIMNEFAL